MRYPLILGLVFFLPSVTMTNAFALDRHWPAEIFEVMDNHRLVIFLDDEDIVKSPEWQPATSPPPLTIAEVLKIVSIWISRDSRLSTAWVHEIELKPIKHHENRWYYLLQLQSTNNGKIEENYIAVLFSGKVVPAIAEPAAIK